MNPAITRAIPGQAVGSSDAADDSTRFLKILWQPGDVREIRIPQHDQWRHTASGYFVSPEKLVEAAMEWDGRANIYVTLNPVNPALLARAVNRIADRASHATSDADILFRRFLFIDIDSIRPSGISATDEEMECARQVLVSLTSDLTGQGWPDPLTCMSGNGCYALYALDLPNTAAEHQLVERGLKALAARHNTPTAKIDTGVANAARILGLIGTRKLKGDATADRPHRRSELLSTPPQLLPVPRSLLEELAGDAEPATTAHSRAGGGRGRPLRELLDDARLDYREQLPDGQGIVWYHVRSCPFHGDNHPYECGVGQALDGHYAGKCFHDETKGWQEWKRALGLGDRSTASSGQTANAQESLTSTTFPRTDSGNAEFFAHLNGERVRYDHQRKRWLIWHRHRFAPDVDGEILRLAKQAARQRHLQAIDIADSEERRKEAVWAINTESKARLEAMLALAQAEEPLSDTGQNWDEDPLLLGLPNGVIDLRTGVLRPGRPRDAITMAAGTAFDPQATAPRFRRFLSEIFEDNQELIAFIKRAVGYSLTGLTSEQCFFLLYGRGSNGKSVLLNVLLALFGDYGYAAPFSTFEHSRSNSIPNDVAQLAGRRLVVASETNEGTRLNEARIKQLTGGEPQTARFLNHEYFTFTPRASIFLAVNHRPQVRDDSYGFWRRVRLVPLDRQFSPEDIDLHLQEKLLTELPGILSWAIEGCLEWQKEGLNPPAEVATAVADYEVDSDPLAEFLAECCFEDANASVRASTVFERYRTWAETHKLSERDQLSSRVFGERLSARFEKRRTGAGIVYFGLAVSS